jgi:hypothetical protein
MSIGLPGNWTAQVAQQRSDLSADYSVKQKYGQQRLERGVGVSLVDASVLRQIGMGMGMGGAP